MSSHFSPSRRTFVKTASAGVASAAWGLSSASAAARKSGQPAKRLPAHVEIINPRDRAPLSFIIDDSTALVNMGRYCMPQFATAFPQRDAYKKPWRSWPHEIPDSFVREFGDWCAEHGVKGKYSVVPYPACVGWVDREMPGWSRRELQDSLKLIRDLMVPNWDIHPEMITHTRVIDLKTGRPLQEISRATMENSYPQEKKSVDELAAYLAYALRILKNCGLPCEGVTTPGGFGNMVKTELSLAVQEAVRDVYQAEIPHYFKYVVSGDESTHPKLEHVSDIGGDNPRLTVNVPAATGDWFGGWDGVRESEGYRYSNEDATSGRMVELIERGQPAVMLCHWPGMYGNETKKGFSDFKNVVTALESRFKEQTLWMKPSEMARYWAAKELTRIKSDGQFLQIQAPFACPRFTLRIKTRGEAAPRLRLLNKPAPLNKVSRTANLQAGSWLREKGAVKICFDLPKGKSKIEI